MKKIFTSTLFLILTLTLSAIEPIKISNEYDNSIIIDDTLFFENGYYLIEDYNSIKFHEVDSDKIDDIYYFKVSIYKDKEEYYIHKFDITVNKKENSIRISDIYHIKNENKLGTYAVDPKKRVQKVIQNGIMYIYYDGIKIKI